MSHTESLELGYLAAPDEAAPGVVIVHDVWGLSDHQRDLARRLAADGFAALAVDLYRPLGEVRIEDAGAWMRGLSDPAMLDRVQQAADHLRSSPRVRGGVGVAGFCMGGTYALLAGATLRDVAAVASFYGVLSRAHGLYFDAAGLEPQKKPLAPFDAAARLRCPMVGFFGAEDPYVPLEDVEELRRRLSGAGQPTAVHVYPGAGHAFVNDTRPAMFRPEAAADAWQKMVAFFREHLAEQAT